MIRFFADAQDVSDNSIKLSAEDFKHIRVLRLHPDELFIVCDGNGTDYVCRLGQRADGGTVSRSKYTEREDAATVEIVDKNQSPGEPSVLCRVFLAYSKGDRLDYAVQKSVELGAHEIVLYESERCVAVPRDIPKKTERLQKIALETAKQCNRGIIPGVISAGNFDTMIEKAVSCSALTLLFYELENNLHVKPVLEQHFSLLREHEEYDINSVSLITGPEGGFEPKEVLLAQSKGIPVVSLGSRILRSETAPVVALAALMFHTGNM